MFWQGFFTGQYTYVGVSASDHFRVSAYGLFSFWHVVTAVLAFVVMAMAAALFFRRKNIERFMLGLISVIVVVSMLGTLVYAAFTGVYNLEWFVPLHICNLFGVMLPLCFFFKKVKAFCLNYIVWFGIGGGIVAIVFPITTIVFLGVFTVPSVLVWIHHVAIAVLGIYYVTSGHYRKKLNMFPTIGLLLVLMGASLVFNHFTHANFLFINMARAVQPLSAMNYVFGSFGVVVVIALVVACMLAIHFAYRWFDRRKHLTLRQFVTQSWFIRRIAKSDFLMELLNSARSGTIKTAKLIDGQIKNRAVRKAIALSERFIACVKKSEILTKLFDTALGDFTDSDYLIDTFASSGLLKSLANEFNLSELKQFKSIPLEKLEETFMLGGGGYPLLPMPT